MDASLVVDLYSEQLNILLRTTYLCPLNRDLFIQLVNIHIIKSNLKEKWKKIK